MGFKPQFIEPPGMKRLGFELISEKEGYLQYKNDGTRQWNTDYNKKFPEPPGKIIIFVNTNYADDKFYLCIENDGGTRNCFNGVCETEIFFKLLLESIR